MPAVKLSDFFSDAPYFRQHESQLGACYRLKNENIPNAPGLWIAQEVQRIEVARYNPSAHFLGDAGSLAEARSQYSFETIDVMPGDAVIDYHLSFDGDRDGFDGDISQPSWAECMYAAERKNGALVQFHISKDDFEKKYIFDAESNAYRTQPYQKKLVERDVELIMPDMSYVVVPAGAEVVLLAGQLSVRDMTLFPGTEERLIEGKPLLVLTAGLALRVVNGAMQNPYDVFVDYIGAAKSAFDRADDPVHAILSPQKGQDLEKHLAELIKAQRFFNEKIKPQVREMNVR